MRQKRLWFTMSGILAVLALVLILPTGAGAASKYKVLHIFKIKDGAGPVAGLIFDGTGNLYGTTSFGGNLGDCGGAGCGVVFKLTPNSDGSWTETVLYSFTGGKDGFTPRADLIFDGAGNLYGTTAYGGSFGGNCGSIGCGVVFKLTPNSDGTWTESVLCTFTGSGDGVIPYGGLTFHAAGNLYGTTLEGGNLSDCGGYGCGVVFKLTPNSDGTWTEKVLYSFTGGKDGGNPQADLIFDAAGKNLYGTTDGGGNPNCESKAGCGVVFELSPNTDGSWREKVLHRFIVKGGAYPQGALIFDPTGNLYGTTQVASTGVNGLVFKLTPNADGSWTESVLHRFTSSKDGAFPFAGLIFDGAGNLYGTTAYGGNLNCQGGSGCGVVFELVPKSDGSWTESLLHVFQGRPAANTYGGSLVLDKAGNLYGTTSNCGAGQCQGVVFEVAP
jgi:uncharacterized repeat protein (TIGR03803 family)